MVSHTLARTTYQVLLTAMRDDLLNQSNQQAGLLATVTFIAYMVGVAIMTQFSGRFEPLVTLILGLWVCIGGLLILTVAGDFAQLTGGVALLGSGSAGIWMSVPAIATGAVNASRRGVVMGFLSSAIGFGLVLIGQCVRLVRGVLDDDAAWRPIWAIGAAFAAIVMLLVIALMRPEPTEHADTRISLANLRQVDGWIPLTAAYILFGLVISGYAPFLGAKLTEDGFSEAHVATLYSLIGLSAIFGAVSLGRLSDRVGRRPVMATAMVMIAVASLLVLTGREPFASISAIINGSFSFAFPVLVTATLRDQVSDRAFSNALGALTLLYGISLFVGPVIGGAIGDSAAGFDLLYLLVAIMAVASALLVLVVPSRPEAPQPATAGS